MTHQPVPNEGKHGWQISITLSIGERSQRLCGKVARQVHFLITQKDSYVLLDISANSDPIARIGQHSVLAISPRLRSF